MDLRTVLRLLVLQVSHRLRHQAVQHPERYPQGSLQVACIVSHIENALQLPEELLLSDLDEAERAFRAWCGFFPQTMKPAEKNFS